MADIGHNRPPSMTDTATEVAADINDWLKEHPTIGSEDEAREAKPKIDRLKLALADLEDERKGLVAPLRESVDAINDRYRQPRSALETILGELNKRVDAYIAAEKARRQREADEARRAAEEAEKAAREAEEREMEAITDAELGALDVDILAATTEADAKFDDFKRAERMAARAERDTHVKIGGGWGRALSQRSHTTLNVTDWMKAITAMGLTEDISAAICKSARAYRKLHGKWPDGIEAEVEKRL